ncbi:MAG: MarR family winged helix-turn-helix transcriptional regulator [Candidatus Roseilinea sp.]|uniref:MarR family winged helix-turn-helix transcriptional regulator n=1 Tax=Candidatus Roseilinea sp. TaxID=2838777 RepID=UPI004049C964
MRKAIDPDSLNHLLWQVCRLNHARAHQLFDAIGVYRGQPPLLEALWEQDGLTHSQLAVRLHVTPATMSRMIRRMEKAGLVARKPDPADRRVSRVHLTQAGRDIRSAIVRAIRVIEADTFAGFNDEERALLRRLLEQVRDNLIRVVGTRPIE